MTASMLLWQWVHRQSGCPLLCSYLIYLLGSGPWMQVRAASQCVLQLAARTLRSPPCRTQDCRCCSDARDSVVWLPRERPARDCVMRCACYRGAAVAGFIYCSCKISDLLPSSSFLLLHPTFFLHLAQTTTLSPSFFFPTTYTHQVPSLQLVPNLFLLPTLPTLPKVNCNSTKLKMPPKTATPNTTPYGLTEGELGVVLHAVKTQISAGTMVCYPTPPSFVYYAPFANTRSSPQVIDKDALAALTGHEKPASAMKIWYDAAFPLLNLLHPISYSVLLLSTFPISIDS